MKIYGDCAQIDTMQSVADRVHGFTTNPSLAKAAGVTKYEAFVRQCVDLFPNHSLSFEVVADDIDIMRYQAHKVASWGSDLFIKIPAVTSSGSSTAQLVDDLSSDGLHINVTAIFTPEQADIFNESVANKASCYLSIFAGRIADTCRDPAHIVRQVVAVAYPNVSVLWASAREVFNIKQAHDSGADIITLAPDLIWKYANTCGKDLDEFSQETSAMFYADALAAGLEL